MVKVKGPIISEGSSGALGDTLIFSKCKGTNYVKKFAVPKDIKSDGQLNMRSSFSDAIEVWQELSDSLKEEYNARAVKLQISGYNLFIRDYITAHKGDFPMTIGLVPIGGLIALCRDLSPSVPEPPSEFQSCDGQSIADPESPLFGVLLPDLNRTNRFLRGNQTSGIFGGTATHTHSVPTGTSGTPSATVSTPGSGSSPAGSGTHTHSTPGSTTGSAGTLPLYYTVCWYMRIK